MPSHRDDAQPLTRAEALRRERGSQKRSRSVTRRDQQSSLSVPKVGIAGALGLATVVAPVSGLMAVSAPLKATAANEISAPQLSMSAFPVLPHAPATVEQVRLVQDASPQPAVPQALAAPRSVLVSRPSRSDQRAVLPGCFGDAQIVKAPNGQLPTAMLCTLWDRDHQLRSDAAVSLAKLNVAFSQQFGHPLCVSDAYRTLGEQYAVKARRGFFAAAAGTSVHGLGRAVDLCGGVEDYGSAAFTWMVDNAPRYGWSHPRWAEPGGGGPFEPWHWEYNCGAEAGCEADS